MAANFADVVGYDVLRVENGDRLLVHCSCKLICLLCRVILRASHLQVLSWSLCHSGSLIRVGGKPSFTRWVERRSCRVHLTGHLVRKISRGRPSLVVYVDSWLTLSDCRCLLCLGLGRHRRRNSLLLCGCLILTACGDVCFLDRFYDLLRT